MCWWRFRGQLRPRWGAGEGLETRCAPPPGTTSTAISPGTAVPALTVPAVDVPTVALQLGAVCFGPRDTRHVPAAAGSVRKMLLQGFGLFGLFFLFVFLSLKPKGNQKRTRINSSSAMCSTLLVAAVVLGVRGRSCTAQHHRPAQSSAPRRTARLERGTRGCLLVSMQDPGLACPAQHLGVLSPLWGQEGHHQGTELSPGERNPLVCSTTKRSGAHRSAALQQPLLTASVNDIHPISRCEPRVARRISK